MNYIRKVTIENFQSHEYSELEFSPGLNVIIGPSDQGKSAIIRAIKWVLFNEPRGADFIRHGETSVKVSIEITNGFKIIRERSPSKNRYTLEQPDGTSSVYEGFGNSVPEEIIKAHGIAKVMIDTDSNVSLNLGEQLEGPFLLSETNAVKAKAIGRLTGVHIIDKAVKDCISDIKKETQTENRCRKEIEEIEDKLKAFKELEKLESRIKQREESINNIETWFKRLNQLSSYNVKLNGINNEIDNLKRILKNTSHIDKAEINIHKLGEKKMMLERLNRLKSNYDLNINETAVQEKIIKNTANIELIKVKLDELESKLLLKSKLQNLNKNYTETKKSIQDGNAYLEKVNMDIEKYLEEYEIQLKKMSKCPVCFSIIDEATAKKIISQYRDEHV